MNIHDRARALSAQKQISIEAARSELGRRGAQARKARYGQTAIDARQAADTRKAMGRGYWWQD
jgi:hypothetical protein